LTDLSKIIQEKYNIGEKQANSIVTNRISPHLDLLKDDIHIAIEYPYIDKVYRDSYYNYYSSKLRYYSKETIKLSFFLGEIKDEDFKSEATVKNLAERYVGFIVLRPTAPMVIGRSVINPSALKTSNFECRVVNIPTTVNSIEFITEGFPHSTQDAETITCAETSLWAIMEYFGHKYVEYKPTLPSLILDSLQGVSNERLLPSQGLPISQIAFVLKEFGFGPRIYTFRNSDFHSILSCYIESGIPLIIGLDNRHKVVDLVSGKKGNIGHAVVCIGHESVSHQQIDNLPPSTNFSYKPLIDKNIIVYDNDEIEKQFIFIDDNHPVYQKANLKNPCNYYTDPQDAEWKHCDITCFVAPLHNRIYKEARETKAFISELIGTTFGIPANSELFIRICLASSKSFKQEVALKLNYSEEVRETILNISMPKFIWLAELSTKTLVKQGLNNGIIILDATETIDANLKCLLFALYNDKIVYENPSTLKYEVKSVNLQQFNSYKKNLKSF